MRNTLWISLLVTAGMAYGCGYGDGKEDNADENIALQQLPSSCTTNMDCKVGINIIGDCIEGICRRFCESTLRDCEENTVCEGGVCRPIVDCPAVTFVDDSKSKEYKDKKCVEIFNLTPSMAWSQLVTSDLMFSPEAENLFGDEMDFTSVDFTFELPHSFVTSGGNFSMVTFLAVNYLKLMIAGATMLAKCTKPQILEDGQWVDFGSMSAKYTYNISNNEITRATMISICDSATYQMDNDMESYYKYMTETGKCKDADDQLKCVFDEYRTMISSKPACVIATNLMTVVKGFSSALMKMGKTSSSSSSSYKGASAMQQWIDDIGINDAHQVIYQTDFDKNNEIYSASQLDLDCSKSSSGKASCVLGEFPLKYCDAEYWKSNVEANATLRRSFNDENSYMDSPERIRYCNEEDAASSATSNSSDTVTFNGKKLVYNKEKANKLNRQILMKHSMKSQLGTCVYMMNGTHDFSLMRALAHSNDIQLGKCAMHEKLKEATINEQIMPADYRSMFRLLDDADIEKSASQLTPESMTHLAALFSAESLYMNATDPSYIWLGGDSLFPLTINNSSGSFQKNDLILDIAYKSIPAIFEETENSRTPLSESVTFLSYQDDDIIVNSDTAANKYEINDSSHEYVSTFTYSDSNSSKELHASVIYHKNDESEGCPDGKCTFYWYGHKTSESSEGMICGGISISLKHINGYIILDEDDDIGVKKVMTNQE